MINVLTSKCLLKQHHIYSSVNSVETSKVVRKYELPLNLGSRRKISFNFQIMTLKRNYDRNVTHYITCNCYRNILNFQKLYKGSFLIYYMKIR